MKAVYALIVLMCFSCIAVMAQVRISGMKSGKLDSNGEYKTIRGINFIAMADGIWREEVQIAIEKHAPVLGSYINPLPADSYHVTIHPLFTENELPEFFRKMHRNHWDETWNGIIESIYPYIIQLQPLIPGPIHPRYVDTFIGNGVTTLRLNLPHEEAVNMTTFRRAIRDTIGKEMFSIILKDARSPEERIEVREWYDNLFVASSLPSNADSYAYHLTLGYSRKLAERLTTDELARMEEEKDMLDGVVRNLVCPQYGYTETVCSFTLEKPFFGWFTSMVAMEKAEVGADKKGRPSVKMFSTVFQTNALIFEFRSNFFYICFICVVIVVLFFIYKKMKGPGRSKRSILPISVSKAGPHEA